MQNTHDIAHLRLRRQLIEPAGASTLDPAAVVAHLGALQAQDYAGSLWSIALRSAPGTTAADVEAAIADRSIVRTWPMRGTLHLLAPADVRWMLGLLTPRVQARANKRLLQLGVSDATIARSRELFVDALSGGRRISRPDAMAMLEADGIPTGDQRGYLILWTLSQEALICCGPMEDKHQTFVLLDEWVEPGSARQDSPDAERALARLAEKYITARGPASIADFAWWSGIPKRDAAEGLDAIAHRLEMARVDAVDYWYVPDEGPKPAGRKASEGPTVHLLPGFDEYMLGYTDRSLQLGDWAGHYGSSVSANGMFSATLVIDGGIEGTWRRTLKRDRVELAVRPFRPLDAAETSALEAAAERFGEFLQLPADVHVQPL